MLLKCLVVLSHFPDKCTLKNILALLVLLRLLKSLDIVPPNNLLAIHARDILNRMQTGSLYHSEYEYEYAILKLTYHVSINLWTMRDVQYLSKEVCFSVFSWFVR